MIRHQTFSPELGRRVIDSIIVNGDTVPDVVNMAAQAAMESNTPVTTQEVLDLLISQGATVDDDGWIEDHPEWHRP